LEGGFKKCRRAVGGKSKGEEALPSREEKKGCWLIELRGLTWRDRGIRKPSKKFVREEADGSF